VVVDEALGRLAEGSLLAFSMDGQAVASVLDSRARTLEVSLDRLAVRHVPEQATALWQAAAGLAGASGELEAVLLGLRLWALFYLNELGDSAAQAIAVGAPLLHDSERVLGPDHPGTLAFPGQPCPRLPGSGRDAEAIPLHEQTLAASERVLGPDHPGTLTSRNNLALAYQAAGRDAEAIPLHEQTLAASERVLGPDHPHTMASRNNLAAAYRAD
jgi:hypothetical protein